MKTLGLYELVTKAITLIEGEIFVMEYANDLHVIWSEIGHYKSIKNPNSIKWDYTLWNRLFKFMMGLNSEYEVLRQILNHQKVPNLEEAFYIIMEEDNQL